MVYSPQHGDRLHSPDVRRLHEAVDSRVDRPESSRRGLAFTAEHSLQRPRRVLAHERLIVMQRVLERSHVIRGADVTNATAALRASPRRFALFMGEPLNAALKSSCVIASTSRGMARESFDASTSRGRNSATFSASANFTFQGHTSWEECRDNRFEIRLARR